MSNEPFNMLYLVAAIDGELYLKWGPCVGSGGDDCDCVSCVHARDLEECGFDWEEEYQRHLEAKRAQERKGEENS